MTRRQNVPIKTDAKMKELKREIVTAQARSAATREAFQAAKAEFKQLRKTFKRAKKAAKEARKNVKSLKKALREATLAAVPVAPTSKKARPPAGHGPAKLRLRRAGVGAKAVRSKSVHSREAAPLTSADSPESPPNNVIRESEVTADAAPVTPTSAPEADIG